MREVRSMSVIAWFKQVSINCGWVIVESCGTQGYNTCR